MKRMTAKLTAAFVGFVLFAAVVTTVSAQTADELAARGETVARADPLAVELRNREPTAASRRGFDIGMAAAEGQTLAGPGKDRIRDSLPLEERGGFSTAVTFSVDRNRNADLAARGAAIAKVDPRVAAARTADPAVLYWLGFDIATGIFGDPALGANGNTSAGPGSLGIRDALGSDAGKRGFNAAVTFHLGGKSPQASGVATAIDKFGVGAVIDKSNAALPNASKRLILSAEGSYGFHPVVSGKIYLGQSADGEIWLAISDEDGTPFTGARAADIRIETLSSQHGTGLVAALDPSLSRANDGVWHFILPQIESGSHFYRIRVVVDVKAWRTTYEGQAIVRATYTRMPFWNAQRLDGTIWEPPK